MTDISKIYDLISEKKNCLLEFENYTEKMLVCTSEELNILVGNREIAIEKMKNIDEEIQEICKNSEKNEILLKILFGKISAQDIPSEFVEIYDKNMQIRAVASRIKETDIQAMNRIKIEQEKALEKIKSMNQGSEAKAAKFVMSGSAAKVFPSRLGKI